ncbi:MAG: hypothetical protein HQ580_17275 [Planctomycetes bacterium]|nr:hypothetical protein [Planctomycetota bacterium]
MGRLCLFDDDGGKNLLIENLLLTKVRNYRLLLFQNNPVHIKTTPHKQLVSASPCDHLNKTNKHIFDVILGS